MLTREAFLSLDTRPKARVPLPEHNTEIYVRTLTAAQREEWEDYSSGAGTAKPKCLIRASLVAMAACDKQGRPLFTLADIPAISEMGSPFITRIFEAALGLNRVAKEDVDALEGNSEASPSDSSVSASPAN